MVTDMRTCDFKINDDCCHFDITFHFVERFKERFSYLLSECENIPKMVSDIIACSDVVEDVSDMNPSDNCWYLRSTLYDIVVVLDLDENCLVTCYSISDSKNRHRIEMRQGKHFRNVFGKAITEQVSCAQGA